MRTADPFLLKGLEARGTEFLNWLSPSFKKKVCGKGDGSAGF